MAGMNRPDLCTLIWSAGQVSVTDLATLTTYMDEVYLEVIQPLAIQRFNSAAGPLQVSHISLSSPLTIDIMSQAGDGSIGLLALGAFGYALGHSEVIGGWIGNFRASMYRSLGEALREKDRYLRAKAALEVRGQPIARFERDILPGLEMESPEREREGPEAG
jgi:hypothetical protein